YVDMDGTQNDAGKITTINSWTFTTGTTYHLAFDLAGNQRNGSPESVAIEVTVGNFSQTISLAQTDPFTHYDLTFVGNGTLGQISFEGSGGDQVGMLLDNVQLFTVVPLPLPAAAAAAGLGLIAIRRRRAI